MEIVKDPVCGMVFVKEDAADSIEYQKNIFYFCAPSCKKSFEIDPEKYLENFDKIRFSISKNNVKYDAGKGDEKNNGVCEHN